MKWFLGLLVLFSTLYADVTVIASDGKVLASSVSEKASRCDYYFVIDGSGKVLETVQNAHKDVRGGASSKLVALLKDRKASHIIAASFGEKLIGSLQSNDIRYTVYRGTVKSAIEQLIKSR